MNDVNASGAAPASRLEAGNTCPACQQAIGEGQLVAKCGRCSSLQHDACWQQHGGCTSYSCDDRVNMEGETGPAELVITADELRHIVPPPPRPKGFRVMPAAEALLKPAPVGPINKLAIASSAIAVVSLFGLWGAVQGSLGLLIIGLCLALASVLAGIIAMVSINSSRGGRGTGIAALGTLVSGVALIGFFLSIGLVMGQKSARSAVRLVVERGMPREEDLAQMPPARAAALRGNVVVTCRPRKALLGSTSTGSGIVTKCEGNRAYILTNRHVVDGSDDAVIEVLFYNGESSDGHIEWRAPGEIDLVVLSCQALVLRDHPALDPRSDLLGTGDAVFAVGNPMGLHWSYTQGVISGIRHQREGDVELAFYQTQTPINCGNSGGGLYDADGRLAGINTWTQDKSVTEGLSFAIASTSLLAAMDEATKVRFFKVSQGVDGAGAGSCGASE